jgi:hypothetical protein
LVDFTGGFGSFYSVTAIFVQKTLESCVFGTVNLREGNPTVRKEFGREKEIESETVAIRFQV